MERHYFYKWVCHTGGETFKRRLVCCINNYGLKQLVPLLKSFIANMLKCKAHLNTKFKCVFVTMCFLVMSPFSRDYLKMEIDQLKYQQCFN